MIILVTLVVSKLIKLIEDNLLHPSNKLLKLSILLVIKLLISKVSKFSQNWNIPTIKVAEEVSKKVKSRLFNFLVPKTNPPKLVTEEVLKFLLLKNLNHNKN